MMHGPGPWLNHLLFRPRHTQYNCRSLDASGQRCIDVGRARLPLASNFLKNPLDDYSMEITVRGRYSQQFLRHGGRPSQPFEAASFSRPSSVGIRPRPGPSQSWTRRSQPGALLGRNLTPFPLPQDMSSRHSFPSAYQRTPPTTSNVTNGRGCDSCAANLSLGIFFLLRFPRALFSVQILEFEASGQPRPRANVPRVRANVGEACDKAAIH